ncbi:hypothetical protein, partial [Modestobacter marinus]
LAGVVLAECQVIAGTPDLLHLRFLVPPLQAGVLPSGFHWTLTGGLAGVDISTIQETPFPGEPRKGTLSISCQLP